MLGTYKNNQIVLKIYRKAFGWHISKHPMQTLGATRVVLLVAAAK